MGLGLGLGLGLDEGAVTEAAPKRQRSSSKGCEVSRSSAPLSSTDVKPSTGPHAGERPVRRGGGHRANGSAADEMGAKAAAGVTAASSCPLSRTVVSRLLAGSGGVVQRSVPG